MSATLIASVAILPVLLTGYALSGARARKLGPDCALVELESIELDRALLLYEKASAQLKQIREQYAALGVLARCRRKLMPRVSAEEKSLQAYAAHLRATIVRLRASPVRRFRRWMHLSSSHVAFSSCLLLYAAIVGSLMAVLWEHPAWAHEVKSHLDKFFTWKPFDDRLFYANWVAANVAPIALPMLYCIRRAKLRSKHRVLLQDFKAFAGADPDTLIALRPMSDEGEPQSHDGGHQSSDWTESDSAPTQPLDETWFDVLRVAPWAGIDEIKTAYKLLIKQNHPDRVHGMAPLFHELAEMETKRINAAYQEALVARSEPAWMHAAYYEEPAQTRH